MAERVEVMLSEEEVDRRIQEIGEQISKDYAGKQVHLVCVLKGGSFFLCELAKRITVPVSLDFMSVSSYGGDTKSSGVIKIVKDLDEPLARQECYCCGGYRGFRTYPELSAGYVKGTRTEVHGAVHASG